MSETVGRAPRARGWASRSAPHQKAVRDFLSSSVMGWGATPRVARSGMRDPILAGLLSSPDRERRVKKWNPRDPIKQPPACIDLASPVMLREGVVKAVIMEVRLGGADCGLQPSMKSQLVRAEMIAKVTRAFEAAGRLRQQNAAKTMQRQERQRQQRKREQAHAATTLQHAERGRQRRAKVAAELAAREAAEAAAKAAAEAEAAKAARDASPFRMLRALGSIFGDNNGGAAGTSASARQRTLEQKARAIRAHLDLPASHSVEAIAAAVPRAGGLHEKIDELYDRIVRGKELEAKAKAVREKMGLPESFGIAEIAAAVPRDGSVHEKIDELHARVVGTAYERKLRAVRRGLGISDSFSAERLAAMVPLPHASVEERIDALHEKLEGERKLRVCRRVLGIDPSYSPERIAAMVPLPHASVDERLEALYEKVQALQAEYTA